MPEKIRQPCRSHLVESVELKETALKSRNSFASRKDES